MKYEPWDRFFPRLFWQPASRDPDLIWIAPMLMGMGFIAPWILRLLAAVIAPVLRCWGGVLLVVAVGKKIRRQVLR